MTGWEETGISDVRVAPRGRMPFRHKISAAIAGSMLAVSVLGGFMFAPTSANHPCSDGSLPAHYTPPDPTVQRFELEGRVTAVNVAARTITANGMTITVPDALGIDTGIVDTSGAPVLINFGTGTNEVLDPGLEAVRTIVEGNQDIPSGSTIKASGRTDYVPVEGGHCMQLNAEYVFIEIAENGVIGPLMEVNYTDDGNATNDSFVVNGTTVKMNTDPRFPSVLVDLGGNPITVADLDGNAGALMSVGGYFENGVLYGTAVEAEVLMKQDSKDTVAIEKAQWQQNQLRVVGLISRDPDTGLYAQSVDVYVGKLTADNLDCAARAAGGAKLGSASVAADGTFDYRVRISTAPSDVCVASPNGGVDDRPVVRK